MRNVKLEVNLINNESFKEFGYFIDKPSVEPTIELNGVFKYYDKIAVLDMKSLSSIGMLEIYKREPTLKLLEKHENTDEMLIALDADFTFIVASSDSSGEMPHSESARAFSLKKGQAVTLKTGVWHWLPFPMQSCGRLLVMIKEGTPENDVISFDIEKEMNLQFEIV